MEIGASNVKRRKKPEKSLKLRNFCRDQQRAQKVFKAQQPLDLPAAKNKLLGFGVQLLDGIDPNPDNMVCAGIIHTQGQQVGCLLRLEPNRQAQVRSSFRMEMDIDIPVFFRLNLIEFLFSFFRCSD